jgi:hypothetical protein
MRRLTEVPWRGENLGIANEIGVDAEGDVRLHGAIQVRDRRWRV